MRNIPRQENIPAVIKALPQWVCWRYIEKQSKRTKIPLRPNGTSASTTDSDTWSSFSVALDAYQQRQSFSGIGFVFTASDPFTGIDVDHCLDERRAPKPWAQSILDDLAKVAYCEISPSGSGIKAWTIAALPPNSRHKVTLNDGHLEVYDRSRYFTVTGDWLNGTISEGQAALDSIVAEYLKQKPMPQPVPRPARENTSRDVSALIHSIRQSKQGTKFVKLFLGNWSDYQVGDEGASRADEALCCMIAFWTQDSAQIDAIFRQSGLMRPKWDAKHTADGRTYGQMTIDFALANLRETYKPTTQHTKPLGIFPTNNSTSRPPPHWHLMNGDITYEYNTLWKHA